MEDKVLKTIHEHNMIKKGDRIVLGLSGGPDSLCLFDILLGLSGDMGFELSAVHVDHNLRPGDSAEDARFVRELCAARGVVCREFAFDCAAEAAERGMTEEEAGRMFRYEAFDTACEEAGGGRIAVAQNGDDQCETMLFRLMRGTGPDGLAAMRYVRKSRGGFDIIRPLLDVSREEIEDYCESKGLEPRIDRTNSDRTYSRNRIRLELLPYMEREFNGNVKEALLRLSGMLAVDREYMEAEAGKALESIRKGRGISRTAFLRLPEALKGRVLLLLMKEAGLEEDVTHAHLEAVEASDFVSEDLPGGYRCVCRYGEIYVCGDYVHEPQGRKVRAVFDRGALLETFGTDEVEIRGRRPGDYIRLKQGRKKLKDLFIDMKIPREEREHIRVAAIGSEVLWVPGYRYSAAYRAADDAEDVLELVITI